MKDLTFKFSFRDLKLTVNQISEVMGYKEGEDSDLVSGLIEEVLIEANEICNVRAQYVVFNEIKFIKETRSLSIKESRFNIKSIVFSQLKKAEAAAVFMCTAGSEIGARSRQAMSEKDLLRGYVYDVIGSEIVEAAADLMQAELEESAASSGLKITNRYSPGYCGWSVAEQHQLFSLVPDNFCGIHLTESALMDPVKSVSGIIGIGKDVKLNPYTCGMCDMKDCIYRKVKDKRQK
jgi:hypothetical protein